MRHGSGLVEPRSTGPDRPSSPSPVPLPAHSLPSVPRRPCVSSSPSSCAPSSNGAALSNEARGSKMGVCPFTVRAILDALGYVALQSTSLTSAALYFKRRLLKRRSKATRLPGTRSVPEQLRSSDICTNKSLLLQPSDLTKPQPFSTLYDTTVPVCILALAYRNWRIMH